MQYIVKFDENHKKNIEEGLELLEMMRRKFRIRGEDSAKDLKEFYQNLDKIKPSRDDKFIYVDIVKRRVKP